jgi:hypothetical protein
VFRSLVEPGSKPFQSINQPWSGAIEHLIAVNEHNGIRNVTTRMSRAGVLYCGKFPPPFREFKRRHCCANAGEWNSTWRNDNALGRTGNNLCTGSNATLTSDGIERM